jgi:hypothetical protein
LPNGEKKTTTTRHEINHEDKTKYQSRIGQRVRASVTDPTGMPFAESLGVKLDLFGR